MNIMARSAILILIALLSLSFLWKRDRAEPAAANDGGSEAVVDETAPPTFASGVASLVYGNCTPCHHDGGSGPFPLVDYAQIKRRAKQIAIVTETRFMPPWKPAPDFGDFHDVRRLEEDEIAMLTAWAEAGAPLGDEASVPPTPTFEHEWLLGEPDEVLSMTETYVVPAEGKDDYRSFVIPSGWTEERYVRAFDFRPDNPPPVHHIITLVDDGGWARRFDQESPDIVGLEGMVAEGELFGTEIHGWGPGGTPRFLPEGSAWKLPANTDFVLDTHFQTTGREEPVQISIGVYYADEVPEAPMANLSLSATLLCIPPEKDDYMVDYSFELPTDVEVVSIQPHAHYLGTDIRVVAKTPEGKTVPLIHIPDWDFSWQDNYRYVEPFALPAKTRIEMSFRFDNTSTNDRNPFSPPRRIISGPRWSDEMALLWVQVAVKPENKALLTKTVVDYNDHVLEVSAPFIALFNGVIHGFDADKNLMLDAEEDALATAYMNALPDHPHAAVFDADQNGVIEGEEREFLEAAIAMWNGERPLANPH